jgi:hypothetical protein
VARIQGWVVATGLMVCASVAVGQEVRQYTENGTTYRETRTKSLRPVTETVFEDREQTVYRENYSTETRDVTRLVHVPVTEYRWEAYWAGVLNPFAKPHLAYRYVPVTRWELRSETISQPVTTRTMVPEKQVVKVPVTRRRMVEEEVTRRVAVNADPFNNGPTVAKRETIGGTRLESDPPRQGADWRTTPGVIRR